MPKRRRRKRKPKQSRKSKQLIATRHTNMPRFLAMLAAGLLLMAYGWYFMAREKGLLPGDEPVAEAPAPAPTPAAP